MKIFENITPITEDLLVGLADNDDEVKQAQVLRYNQLVLDYSEENKRQDETDASEYDKICDHIIVKDTKTNKVVGTYRLLSSLHLKKGEEFISELEFDITKLKNCGREILELGRAVVDANYRNGIAIKLLWRAIFAYAHKNNIKYLFGTASFHGVDKDKFRHAFTNLARKYMADESVMCYAKEPNDPLKLVSDEEFNPSQAKLETPSLIMGYLALGAKVGTGVFRDIPFNSSDVMIICDLENINRLVAKRMFGVE